MMGVLVVIAALVLIALLLLSQRMRVQAVVVVVIVDDWKDLAMSGECIGEIKAGRNVGIVVSVL
jgi:hypothetical protein